VAGNSINMGKIDKSNRKILVTGHKGMLGGTLMGQLDGRAVGIDLPEFDMTQPEQIRAFVHDIRPSCLINCAAFTNVDGAETQSDQCRLLNVDAVENLGIVCKEEDVYLVTVSTDYVFTGKGDAPWPEDAPPEAFWPLCVYGRSKLDGERRLESIGGRWAIARTQWLYGSGGKNFIDTIADLASRKDELRVVDDQVGAPTWAEDLAQALIRLSATEATGYYHTVNSGFVSWFEVAQRIVERLGLECRIVPCASEAYPLPATRPHNSRLDQSHYADLAGEPMRPWDIALDAYLRSTGRLSSD
jgi:dTDP-4-dehydrorhamnose reductase